MDIIIMLIISIIALAYVSRHESLPKLKGKKEIVQIINMRFKPSKLTIWEGDTVEFVNLDDVRHTVNTVTEHIPNSRLLKKDVSFSYTFENMGEYLFHSELYNNMNMCAVRVKRRMRDWPRMHSFSRYHIN